MTSSRCCLPMLGVCLSAALRLGVVSVSDCSFIETFQLNYCWGIRVYGTLRMIGKMCSLRDADDVRNTAACSVVLPTLLTLSIYSSTC